MQVETELRDMFSYSLPIIIILGIILIVLIIFLLFSKKKKVKKEIIKQEVIIPKYKDLMAIKRMYLNKIDKLYYDITNNKINNREAYQTLSKLIRNYIYESTNIKVQNYTLEEIKKVNIPILYELVSEYYDPEFSVISGGNIINSTQKTRSVIERWR